MILSIPSFEEGMVLKVENDLKKFCKEIKNITIDLRDNRGGKVEDAIKLVDMFVNDALVVTIVQKSYTKKFFTQNENTLCPLPLKILVNNQTASSAEIIAGVLKKHKDATIVGGETYKKEKVQALIYLDETKTDFIKLTVGKYIL